MSQPKVLLPGLQIDSPLANPQASNFRPPWPPPDDFPVVINADGEVVSRYGDPSWNLAPWAGHALTVGFGDGTTRGTKLSAGNAALLRRIAAWWLYGPRAVQAASTLAQKVICIKPLFAVCTEARVLASDLRRYPKLIEQVASRLRKSEARKIFAQLHDLWTVRETLGFELLDQAGLMHLSGLLPDHESTQTAYIPPRIWTYQVLRLRECIDDYLAHRDEVEACYRFCLEAYAKNAGSLAHAFNGMKKWHVPFHAPMPAGYVTKHGRHFYGRFRNTAERYGIDGLLNRWVDFTDATGIGAFSHYLSLVSRVGLAYILNFSLMRVDEGSQLRAGCHSIESDSLGDEIHMLSTGTSKTLEDKDARWIVSPSVEVAIQAMTSVARLRTKAAKHDPRLRLDPSEIRDPMLQARAHEPWLSTSFGSNALDHKTRKKCVSYGDFFINYPRLFDLERLRITEEDLVIARRMTFGLDPKRYAVGKPWPLSWHQLRRTGACNMLSTGIVSESSLQYQLKHAAVAMSRYYGQNYYKLKGLLDEEAREFFVRQMYETLAREFKALEDDRFVSPHGAKRKAQILEPINERDHRALVKDCEMGRVSYRETFLGGCAKPAPACPLGGISNISGCMGHGRVGACEWVLLDRTKRPVIEKLRKIFRGQLRQAPEGSLLKASLEASVESAERAIHVIDTV
jgi:hypothetical protein